MMNDKSICNQIDKIDKEIINLISKRNRLKFESSNKNARTSETVDSRHTAQFTRRAKQKGVETSLDSSVIEFIYRSITGICADSSCKKSDNRPYFPDI